MPPVIIYYLQLVTRLFSHTKRDLFLHDEHKVFYHLFINPVHWSTELLFGSVAPEKNKNVTKWEALAYRGEQLIIT